jgi:putative aldouronate transport system substrate-binding protein
MRRKTFIPLLLTAAIAAAGLAGCEDTGKQSAGAGKGMPGDKDYDITKDPDFDLTGGLPILKNPDKMPHITVVDIASSNRLSGRDLAQVKRFEKETGLVFDWQIIPAEGAAEKINLMISSGDLPDMFFDSIETPTVLQYEGQDVFIPTQDLIQKYVPRLVEIFNKIPRYKAEATTPTGNMYGFPWIEQMRGLIRTPGALRINKKWLDAVGKPMPATTDEFADVLRAFKKAGDLNGNGKADEYALAMATSPNGATFGSYNTFSYFAGAFGQADPMQSNQPAANHLFVNNDGKIIFTALNPAYKETAKYFNKLYSEGLIDPVSFENQQNNQPKYLATYKGLKYAVLGALNDWRVSDWAVGADYAAVPRLTGPAGKTGFLNNNSEMQAPNRVTITTAAKYPELLAAFVNYLYTPEVSATTNWGAEGYAMIKDAQGVLTENRDAQGNIVKIDGIPENVRENSSPGMGAQAFLNEYFDVVMRYPYSTQTQVLDQQIAAGKNEIMEEYKNNAVPQMMLTSQEAIAATRISEQTSAIVNKYIVQWTMEGNVDATWDGYTAALKAAGVDKLLEIYQAAYERFLKNLKK